MTWVTKARNGAAGEEPGQRRDQTRCEIEGLGIKVIESELHDGRQSHRIAIKDWCEQAKGLMAAGFVPRADNDQGPKAAAPVSSSRPHRD